MLHFRQIVVGLIYLITFDTARPESGACPIYRAMFQSSKDVLRDQFFV